ncbi:MAG TPA: tRNA (N6-isopentenyl adenosine(37)-C2)-methylthiotransferase MiaB, partial [Chitinophagaceae bacterium]|nr:tRNA (N6-isopentenyl adenosine(37)-C2)-methylthiotransferase MiaB [Chitinophagaceae bacterium]
RRYPDDIPAEVKNRRLNEIISLHRSHSEQKNKEEIGKIHLILVEGPSKKNPEEWCGRTDTNKMVIFPKGQAEKCQFVNVRITDATSGTLKGEIFSN